jgi:acetyl esterase/lipase
MSLKRHIGAGSVIVLLSCAATAVAESGEPRVLRDVEYARVGEDLLKLDLYLPTAEDRASEADKGSAASPLVVWVHGGAWRSGSKADVPILPLARRGFAIASVDYRLSPVAKFPAQVLDLHAAIRFLRVNAGAYGIDPKRIAVAGSSAGGHLAALVGVSADVEELTGKRKEKEESDSQVGAVVSFYGASNLESILSQSTDHGRSVRVPALKLLLGGPPEKEPRLARLASPVAHVDASDPPLLWIHGDADPQMPYAQALEMRDAYAKLDLPVELITVEGGLHGGERFYDDIMLKRVAEFLEQHLKATDEAP